MRTFSGAWPALVTPFTGDDRVNVSALRDLTQYLLDKGVNGFYVCGSTGEGLYMSLDERKLVTETVLAQVQGQVPVIVQVGCVALRDAIELAQHAGHSGADGISSMLPPLYRSSRALYAYFERLAASVPDLPVLPYLFGGPTDAMILMRELMRIPNVAGTKYTSANMHEFSRIAGLRADGWTAFSGMDEQCLFAAMSGSSGNIGSTLNVRPGAYLKIHECYRCDDLAQAMAFQNQANKITSALLSFSFPGALREALRMLGFNCGQPRLPDLCLTETEREALHSRMQEAGLARMAAL